LHSKELEMKFKTNYSEDSFKGTFLETQSNNSFPKKNTLSSFTDDVEDELVTRNTMGDTTLKRNITHTRSIEERKEVNQPAEENKVPPQRNRSRTKTKNVKKDLSSIKEEEEPTEKSSQLCDSNEENAKEGDLHEFSPFVVNPIKRKESKGVIILDAGNNFEENSEDDEEGSLPAIKLAQMLKLRQEIKNITKGYMINLRIMDYLELVDKFTKAIE
jgi:hypothetical protein